MARFYALRRERRQARHAAPRRGRRAVDRRPAAPARAAALRGPAAAAERRRPGGARASSSRVSARDARADRHVVGVFGTFPVPIAGKTGTAEKIVSIPGYPTGPPGGPGVVVRLRARRQPVDRRLRGDRERRPRRRRRGAGGAEGVRAVLRQARRRSSRRRPTDGVRGRRRPRPRAPPPPSRRGRSASSGSFAASTGCCSPRWPRSSASASGRSTGSRVTIRAEASPARQAVYVGGGRRRASSRLPRSTRTSTAASSGRSTSGRSG